MLKSGQILHDKYNKFALGLRRAAGCNSQAFNPNFQINFSIILKFLVLVTPVYTKDTVSLRCDYDYR